MEHVLRLRGRENPPAPIIFLRAEVVDAGIQQFVLQQTRVGQAVLSRLVVSRLPRRVDGPGVLLGVGRRDQTLAVFRGWGEQVP